MPFGIFSAPEEHQRRLCEELEALEAPEEYKPKMCEEL